jgi:hypothetical protein
MRRSWWLAAVGLCVLAAGLIYAGTSAVSKQTLWIVPYDYQGTLQVQTDDAIEVWTEPLAVIPANLESRFRASRTGRGVELIGDTLPHREGTMERLFLFKAFDPGPAALKVELVGGDGQVRSTRTYAVEVVAPKPSADHAAPGSGE